MYRHAFDDPALKDPPNEFVQLLWKQGTQYEAEIIEALAGEKELFDLSAVPAAERATKTLQALAAGTPLIYHGRLETEELLGEPDLLERLPNGDYLPVDIKSGMALKSGNEEQPGKYKDSYAVQLALYTDALRQLGYATHFRGAIWDSRGQVVDYDLALPRRKRSEECWWNYYEAILLAVRMTLDGRKKTFAALSGDCSHCEWKRSCKEQCIESRCLSLIPELGRAKKEALSGLFATIDDLAAADLNLLVDPQGKTGIPGIGPPTLEKFIRRARLLTDPDARPLLLQPLAWASHAIELFFDIEADPTRDIVYLHGVIERRDRDPRTDRFHAFIARETSATAEAQAWAEFWAYLRALPAGSWALYHYGVYERTQYRNLARKYPDISSPEQVEDLFAPEQTTDLYRQVILPKTDWPTYNKSVKTIAQYCGFAWRDEEPSGAGSIEWFNEYCRDRDPQKLQRLLDYNEDDCRAMAVLKTYLEELQVQGNNRPGFE